MTAGIAEFGEEGKCLRVSIYSVGRTQQYGLAFDLQRPGDLVISFDGLTVLVDPESAERLKGTVVDFGEYASGTGFRFVRPQQRSDEPTPTPHAAGSAGRERGDRRADRGEPGAETEK